MEEMDIYDGIEYQNDEQREALQAFNLCAQNVATSLCVIGGMLNATSNIVSKISDTVVEISRLDHQLDCLLATLDMKLEKFKLVVPVMEKQLNNISGRIDMITEAILEKNKGEMSEEGLKQQAILLDTLSQASESFNNMIFKLMMI